MKGRDSLRVHAPSQPADQQVVSEYEFLVEQMRQGVWRLDATGKVIEANGAACKWLGVGIEELVGQNVSKFLSMDVNMIRDEVFEAEFVTRDGVRRVAVVSSRTLRHESGMLLGALQSQDMYLAGSFLMFLAALTVIGVLVSDLALAMLDPRIRLQGGTTR